MENASRDLGNDGRKEENHVLHAIGSLESKEETLASKTCRGHTEPDGTLILDIRRSRASASCKELFFQNIHGLHNCIPKHITTVDEKYVLRCLELIRNCALRAATRNFTSKADILSSQSNLLEIKNNSLYSMDSRLAIDYPLGDGTEVVINSSSNWTVGTLSGSQSMINILKSPLLQNFGSFDSGKTFDSEFIGSLQEPTNTVSHKLQKDVKVLDHKYVSGPLHKRDASIWSTNSSFSDLSSSSACSFQGMLQCTWKDGLPRHVFTVDDKQEVYVAKLAKVNSLDIKASKYFYTFHLVRNGNKEFDTHELELETVAKMQVCTSTTFPPDNSEVRETQFVLSVSNDNHIGETKTSNHSHKKNKRLTRKVVDMLSSYKQRSSSKLGRSNPIVEDTSMDPSRDVHNNFQDVDENCADAPNHELAAIIVKDICDTRKEGEVGGWGLKFLKKPAPLDTMIPYERSQNTGECSTSIDVLIPAGFHGGPRTRVGGPSRLIDRWISGGRCDCGGWDIGCPLTVLNSTTTDYSSQCDNSSECKSVDLFMKGSKQNVPAMKMVNIRKGLYYVYFQSTLSSLQSFAVAAAMIHSHNDRPLLRSKVYRS